MPKNTVNVKVAVYGTFTYSELKWFLISLPSEIQYVCSDRRSLNDVYLKAFADDYGRTLFKTSDPYAVSDIVYCFGSYPVKLIRLYPRAKFIKV